MKLRSAGGLHVGRPSERDFYDWLSELQSENNHLFPQGLYWPRNTYHLLKLRGENFCSVGKLVRTHPIRRGGNCFVVHFNAVAISCRAIQWFRFLCIPASNANSANCEALADRSYSVLMLLQQWAAPSR